MSRSTPWLKQGACAQQLGHAGDRIRVNRIGRETQTVPAAAMNIFVMVQPEVFGQVGTNAELRHNGFLARFLISPTQSRIGGRSFDSPPIPSGVAERYASVVRRLVLDLLPETDEDGNVVPVRELHCTPEARKVMQEVFEHTEAAMRLRGDLRQMHAWGSKFPGAVARIAALLALADDPETRTVDARHALAAQTLGAYYRAAALFVFGVSGAESAPPISDTSAAVVAFVSSRPSTTAPEVAAHLGMSGDKARTYLRRAAARGDIAKLGRGRYAPATD